MFLAWLTTKSTVQSLQVLVIIAVVFFYLPRVLNIDHQSDKMMMMMIVEGTCLPLLIFPECVSSSSSSLVQHCFAITVSTLLQRETCVYLHLSMFQLSWSPFSYLLSPPTPWRKSLNDASAPKCLSAPSWLSTFGLTCANLSVCFTWTAQSVLNCLVVCDMTRALKERKEEQLKLTCARQLFSPGNASSLNRWRAAFTRETRRRRSSLGVITQSKEKEAAEEKKSVPFSSMIQSPSASSSVHSRIDHVLSMAVLCCEKVKGKEREKSALV